MRATYWEYCIVEAGERFAGQADSPIGALDHLGNQGWELVAVMDGRMYMKRPTGESRRRGGEDE